jgi:hypothetical protein
LLVKRHKNSLLRSSSLDKRPNEKKALVITDAEGTETAETYVQSIQSPTLEISFTTTTSLESGPSENMNSIHNT